MQVTVPYPGSFEGLRPINLNTDIPEVLRLLEQVFGAKLDASGRQLLISGGRNAGQPAFLWRLSPAASKLALGYVWERDGRIIGNVTILTTAVKQRFLVVNVAVHPDYRRQGIARRMMHKVTEVVRQRGGNQILLQVVKQNEAAIALYQSLHYRTLGSMRTWNAEASRIRPVEAAAGPGRIRELRRSEWRLAYDFDRHCLHPDLNWPEPPEPETYRTGILRRIGHFLNGRAVENWLMVTADKKIAGMATLVMEYGRSHNLAIRVAPEWRGQVEQALLGKMLRRIQLLPRRRITLIHPDDDNVMNELLRECLFSTRRTLTHMRLDLDIPEK